MGSLFLSAAAALSIVFIEFFFILELCSTADENTLTQPANVTPESHTHTTYNVLGFTSLRLKTAHFLIISRDQTSANKNVCVCVCVGWGVGWGV